MVSEQLGQLFYRVMFNLANRFSGDECLAQSELR